MFPCIGLDEVIPATRPAVNFRSANQNTGMNGAHSYRQESAILKLLQLNHIFKSVIFTELTRIQIRQPFWIVRFRLVIIVNINRFQIKFIQPLYSHMLTLKE